MKAIFLSAQRTDTQPCHYSCPVPQRSLAIERSLAIKRQPSLKAAAQR